MTWSRILTPLALLVIALPLACEVDDGDDSGADSGSTPTTDTGAATAMPGTADETGDSTVELGCAAGAVGDTTDGATEPLMLTWGAPCTTDAQCQELIGDPDAICQDMAVVYEMPGGYCTKPCQLPDLDTRVVLDAPDCDPDGGVACTGVMGAFERCGLICTDDSQCNRDGYICRLMPMIGQEGDPKTCLMPDCCLNSCTEG